MKKTQLILSGIMMNICILSLQLSASSTSSSSFILKEQKKESEKLPVISKKKLAKSTFSESYKEIEKFTESNSGAMVLSQDKQMIVIASGSKIKIRQRTDQGTWQTIATLEGHTDIVTSIALQ